MGGYGFCSLVSRVSHICKFDIKLVLKEGVWDVVESEIPEAEWAIEFNK